MQLRATVRCLLVCVGLLLACPAWAHGGDAGPLWGGALHVLASPLALAALLGLVAALWGIDDPLCFSVAAMTGVSAAVVAVLAAFAATYLAERAGVNFVAVLWANFSAALAPLGVVLIGLTALIGWRHTRHAALSLALLAGSTVGLAAQLDNSRWQSLPGLAGCTALIAVTGLMAFHKFEKWARLRTVWPIVRRVLGSWVTALGLLLAALAVHSGASGLGWLK